MRTVEENMAFYASYHRNTANKITHFVGIPLIVFSVVLGLSAVHIASLGGFALTADLIVLAAASVFWLKMDLAMGGVLAAIVIGMHFIAQPWAASMTAGEVGMWFGIFFFVGWAWQFLGHKFEGKKPAFMDDLSGLMDGPLFLVMEVFFALGLKGDLHEEVERRVASPEPPAGAGVA